MGCNCKANEEIIKLQRKYGSKRNLTFNEKFRFYSEESVKMVILIILVIILFPLLCLGLLITALTGHGRINIKTIFNKFLRKKRNE